MDYTVSIKPRKIVFTVFEWIFFDTLLIFPMIITLITNSENLRNDMKFLTFYAVFMTIMQVIFALYLYKLLRPRIKVRGENVIFYPRWKKKISVNFAEICDEFTVICGEVIPNTDEAGNTVRTSSPPINRNPNYRFITYFIDGKPAIQIHTKMKNAELFDAEVRRRLGNISPENCVNA